MAGKLDNAPRRAAPPPAPRPLLPPTSIDSRPPHNTCRSMICAVGEGVGDADSLVVYVVCPNGSEPRYMFVMISYHRMMTARRDNERDSQQVIDRAVPRTLSTSTPPMDEVRKTHTSARRRDKSPHTSSQILEHAPNTSFSIQLTYYPIHVSHSSPHHLITSSLLHSYAMISFISPRNHSTTYKYVHYPRPAAPPVTQSVCQRKEGGRTPPAPTPPRPSMLLSSNTDCVKALPSACTAGMDGAVVGDESKVEEAGVGSVGAVGADGNGAKNVLRNEAVVPPPPAPHTPPVSSKHWRKIRSAVAALAAFRSRRVRRVLLQQQL